MSTADLHVGLSRYGLGLERTRAVLDRLVQTAIDREVQVVVIAGDSFHSKRPPAADILIFVLAIRRLLDAGIQVLVSPGNHDASYNVEDPFGKTAAWMAEFRLPGFTACPVPTTVELAGQKFFVLPYVHRRSNVADHLSEIIQEHGEPGTIFVGHLSVKGSKLGAETIMQMGWDLTVEAGVFSGYRAAMLGHLHWQQEVAKNVWYAGSPERHDFGEVMHEKGFLLWDLANDTVERIPSGARDLIPVEINDPSDLAFLDTVTKGSVVRIVVKGEVPGWDGIKRALYREAREAGADWVEIENVTERPLRSRVRLEPNAHVFQALQLWCDANTVALERIAEGARELTGEID